MMTNFGRRRFLQSLGIAAAAGAALPALVSARLAHAQERPAAPSSPPNAARAVGAPAALEVVRLEDDLHVIMGAGGNIAVHVGAGATVVVDCGMPQRAADVVAAVGKLAGPASRKVLVNTHWHFDHVGGNAAMVAGGFAPVATSSCHKRLGQTIFFEDLGMTFEPLPEAARPAFSFDTEMTLHAPSDVTLTQMPPSHTDTDATVTFNKHRVLHTGDLFFNGAFPVIDRSTGGSLDGMIAVTSLLLTKVDDKTRIIPGHGPLATRADLQSQLELLKLVQGRLAPFGEKKTPLAEVLDKAPLADLDDKWGRGFLRSPVFTRMAYGQWLTR